MIFDTHAHYDDERFDADRRELLLSLSSHNVRFVLNPGANPQDTEKILSIAKEYDFVYAAYGVHPSYAGQQIEFSEVILQNKEQHKIKAIGECGLDYHYEGFSKEKQEVLFRTQLELAKKYNLPVIVHTRDAIEDTVRILSDYSDVKKVVHCFSENVYWAKILAHMGCYISFTGSVTFKNSRNIRDALDVISNNRIMVETDAPYLSPEPNRGKRCDSTMLPNILKVISDVKGIEDKQIFENSVGFFNI